MVTSIHLEPLKLGVNFKNMSKKVSLDDGSLPLKSNYKANNPKKNATLKDLEKATGVSKSTISRVFNNPEKVKKSTLKLVEKKAEEIGYIPSRVAQRLQAGQGKSKVIGLIIPDIMNPFFAEITLGIEDVAMENGYALILNNSDESEERQKFCLKTLLMERVDGIILPPVNENNEYVKEIVENGFNVICVDRNMRNTFVDSVQSDNERGAYMAVSHLIKLGHERIAYIGGISSISTTQERMRGYKQAIQDAGIEFHEKLNLMGDSKQDSGEILTRKLLEMKNPPTAIFSGNNMTTMGVYVACNKIGVRIPEDLALVGYDDMPWANALNPPPTVIDQSAFEMGQRSADLLLSKIQNPQASPVTVKVNPKLIIRKSCGQYLREK